ncbi:DeoR/GlpR transcriptional regulator [Listeria ivanovii]|uniref:DeoR/GlpR family DNA-binding transcription regulator n=1 Tax=Listeria ivanovii TaxID=1638 RepID=UPI000DA75DD0|nr:DeoR/GlpR family DNA-binding transcription regulator [Listeria ivanovii]PZG40659.1 DeoR/GlpR transcriptional regulator [Listeria ivanovii]
MLKKERHIYILKEVQSEGRALVAELTKKLNVTEDTIRKDMQELSAQGLIRRVHGGALSIVDDKIDFETRIDQNASIKEHLAELAIPLLENISVIFIDGGTSNLKFAEKIPPHFKGRVITNSPSVALALCNHPNIQINLLGGELNKKSRVSTGTFTLQEVEKIYVELCLLGISSIDSNYGITVSSFEESLLKKQLIKQSSQVVSLVTSEKLEKISTFFVDKSTALDYMVTEKSVNKSILSAYENIGMKIIQ